MILHKTRAAQTSDFNFIINSWLKSYRNTPLITDVPNSIFFKNHAELIHNILAKATTIVITAPDDDQHLFGYLVYEVKDGALTLHFVYTKLVYRNLKLIKTIVEQLKSQLQLATDIIFCTHLPKSYQSLKGKKEIIFNPYLLKEFL